MVGAAVNLILDRDAMTTPHHHTITSPLGVTADTRDVGNKADSHNEINSR
jgi:hypothetical protein